MDWLRFTTKKEEVTEKRVRDHYDLEFRFGKYRGKTIEHVARVSPSYIAWYLSVNNEEAKKYYKEKKAGITFSDDDEDLILGREDYKDVFLRRVVDFWDEHKEYFKKALTH